MQSLYLATRASQLAMALSFMCGSAVAGAQAIQNIDDGLQDIVVTAQKREQSLQSVGISVTAVTGERLQTLGITSSAQLAARVPGVDNYSPYGPGTSANVVIRGIGLNDFGDGNEAPVTTYVDEFYLVAVPAVDFGLFDIARAEVLRGPQGTLFGRNSTGGLVNYVTERPGDTFSGFSRVSYGTFNEMRAEAGMTIPLSDKFSARVSGLTYHSDGFVRNVNPSYGRGGEAGTDAVRGQLRFKDNGWDILAKVEYGRQNSNQGYYEEVSGTVDPTTGLVFNTPGTVDLAGYRESTSPAARKNVAWSNAKANLKGRGFTGLFRIEKNTGDTTYSSITGYQDFRRTLAEDSDGTPNDLVFAVFPFHGEEVTQEIRVYHNGDGIKWTAGAYGLYASQQSHPFATFNIPDYDYSGPAPLDPVTGLYNGAYFPLALEADWRQKTRSIAGFAQFEVDLSDQITVIAGGRVTYDDKSFYDADNASLRTCPGGDGSPDINGINRNCYLVSQGGSGIASPFGLKYDKVLLSGKIEIDYKPRPNVLFYASISRGTKSGGFNNGFYTAGLSNNQIIYKDEAMYAFEVGEKVTLFDRRLRINSDIFYYDYSRYQTFSYVGVGGFLGNQDGHAYGAEAEIEYTPLRGLTFQLSGAWLETKLKGVAGPALGYVADRDFAFAPRFSGQGSVTYVADIGEGRNATIGVDFDAKSSRYADNFNNPGTKLESFVKFNANASIDVNEHLNIGAWVKNIGNVRNTVYSGNSFVAFGIIQTRYAMPRTAGGTASFKW